jgi:3-methyladenine DNA glycosylase AlkD
MTAEGVKAALQEYASPEDAVFLQRFFKTGEGQYGAGDTFIGVRVPDTRAVCKKFATLPLLEVKKLLESEVHEHRLAAVTLLANAYKKADEAQREEIYGAYLQAVYDGRVNNWDIVDSSAEFIVGEYLYNKPRDLLFRLAKSDDIWQRRVAVLSTFGFIKKGDASTTLQLAEILLHDPHDLIQKAVGWMLREAGKRCDETLLTVFLERHAAVMPRTMLRYAIERLSTAQKADFMARKKNA